MAELFARAEQDGLWFHCAPQDLWFSPEELRKQQAEGWFCWGAGDWQLRDPRERLAELEAKALEARNAAGCFRARLVDAGVVLP